MNFQELRERADNLSIGHDVLRDLRRALNDLDSAIDSVKDAYSDFDSAIDDLSVIDEVESFMNDIVAMDDPTVEVVDSLLQQEYVWRIAASLLIAESDDDINRIKKDNPTVFWAAVSVALVNYPPFRLFLLNRWVSNNVPVK
jgi:hypothetical protein